jgi:streptogrisin C
MIAAALSSTGRLAVTTAVAFAVIAAAAGAAFASASLADLPSSGAEGPSPLLAKEIAVLTKQGISPARARQALDVQGKVAQANLVSEVEAAMGSAFAGAWFDPAAGRVHFGVTSDASRQAAKQVVEHAGLSAVVTFTPVRSTWSELIAAKSQLDRRLGELSKGRGAMTGLDAQHNAVSVTLSSSIPPEERTVLGRETAVASVNVFVRIAPPSRFQISPGSRCKFKKPFEAYCEKTLVSGVGIGLEGAPPDCSAGPMLIEGNTTYMLTAGHCFAPSFEKEGVVVENVTSSYPEEPPVQKDIGKEGVWKYTEARDMAEVKITSPNGNFSQALPTPVPALMAEWGKKTESPQAVIGAAANMKGETNCHEGMTTGEKCGTIGEVDMTIEDEEKHLHKHLVEDTACGEGGDSGGPFFFSESIADNVHMQGTFSFFDPEKKCSEGGEGTYYEPLKDEGAEGYGILSTFMGQELLTTANETRPAALPDISIALGGSYPLHLEVTVLNVTTQLATTGAEDLKGTGLLLLLLTEALTSLGSFETLFTSVLDPSTSEKCFSENGTTKDSSGLVLTLGTFHIVLRPNGSLELLYLVQALKIVCGAVTVRIRGSVLSSISNATGTEGTEYTSLKGKLSGSGGKPELTEYLNDGGTVVGAKLEADFGAGYVTSDESVAEEVTATALEGKMFVIKPR